MLDDIHPNFLVYFILVRMNQLSAIALVFIGR